ncbi:MAG TPA: M20 family metallopeptidase [Rugosimonospora sp.]|nr:M20 family metallopeptidase [Rugosimonospora sp.]
MSTAEFLDAAGDLLAIPSTADRPEQLRQALEFAVRAAGPATVEWFESGGKPSALLYHGSTRPAFRALLNAHLDVVPAAPEQFRPRREGDRLYARGAHDMKVSALLEVLTFRELAGSLPYPLGLQLVTDEEVGGRHGTRYQLEQGVSAAFVLIGENSNLDIVADSKGLVHAWLHATGRAAHGAYPWLGSNALVSLIGTVNNLLARYPVVREEAWRTTVNVARMDTTNRAVNQIPADASAWLDIRFPPEDADFSGQPESRILAHLSQFCEPGVTVTIDHTDPPHHADHELPELKQLRQAARAQGYLGNFLRKHGAADGRFYSQRGIPAVAFGVGGAGQHGPEEYADLTTVEPYRRALAEFLRDLS